MNQATSALLLPFFYPPYRTQRSRPPSQDLRQRSTRDVWTSGVRRRPSTSSIDPERTPIGKFPVYNFDDSQRPAYLSLKLYEDSGAGESAKVDGVVLSGQSGTGDDGRGGSGVGGVRFGIAEVSVSRVDSYKGVQRALLYDASLVLGVPPDRIAEDVEMWVREPKLGGTTTGVLAGGDGASAAAGIMAPRYHKRRPIVAANHPAIPTSESWWPQWTHKVSLPTLRELTSPRSPAFREYFTGVYFDRLGLERARRKDASKLEVMMGDVIGRRIDHHRRDEYWVAFEASVRYRLQREGRLPMNSGTSWFEAEVTREVARHEESASEAASAALLTWQAEGSPGREEFNESRGAMGKNDALILGGGGLSGVIHSNDGRHDRDGDARASRRAKVEEEQRKEGERRKRQQQPDGGGNSREGEDREFWRRVDRLMLERMRRSSYVGRTLLRLYHETVKGHIRLMGGNSWPDLVRLYERFYSSVLQSTFPEDSLMFPRANKNNDDHARLSSPPSSPEDKPLANHRDGDVGSRNVATKAAIDPELLSSGDNNEGESGGDTGDESDGHPGLGWISIMSKLDIEKWTFGWKGYFPVVPGTAGINSLEVSDDPERTQNCIDSPSPPPPP